MSAETKFTYHGNVRLKGRCTLSDIDIDGYISAGLAVFAGRDGETDKVDWVIWSELDNEAILVVRDERTKEVITVLNQSYQGIQRIKDSLVEVSQMLSRLKGKPSLREVRIRDLWKNEMRIKFRVQFLLRSPDKRGVVSMGVKIPLNEVENPGCPWKDSLILRKLWENLDEHVGIPGKEFVLEQVIMRLEKSTAYLTSYPREILKRPAV
jgi:hypothetical protein